MRISDWSSDVCSSDLAAQPLAQRIDAFKDALALAGERSDEPLSPAAALESEAIQNCAGYQATGKTGQRELEELAVLLALILLPLLTVIGSVPVVVGPQSGPPARHRAGPPGSPETAHPSP